MACKQMACLSIASCVQLCLGNTTVFIIDIFRRNWTMVKKTISSMLDKSINSESNK